MDKNAPYITELLQMYARHPEAFRGKVTSVSVYHSQQCSIFKGGECDCSPDVIMDKPEVEKGDQSTRSSRRKDVRGG